MRKKKKTKATASNAAERSLARQSATPAIDSPAPVGSSGQAVTASDAISPPALPSETDKVGASSNIPSTSQQPSAIRQVDMALGQIVTILMRSPQHKQHPLADLEWLVLPAVLSGQCRVARAQQSGIAVPVGVALWASVSTAVDQRLSDLSVPWRLQSDEWRSGDIPWSDRGAARQHRCKSGS
jgi:hemolysin-activating ACP:hemolysin acyltransferase